MGLLAGGLLAWILIRRRSGPHYDSYLSDRIHNYNAKGEGNHLDSPQGNPSHYSAIPSDTPVPNSTASSRTVFNSLTSRRLLSSNQYEIEPFRLPDEPAPQDSNTALISPNDAGSVTQEGGESGLPAIITRSPSRPSSSSQNASHQAERSSTLSADPTSPSQASHPRTATSQVYVVHHDAGRAPVTVYTPDGTEVIELPPRYDGSTNELRPPQQQRRNPNSIPSKGSRLLPTSNS